MIYEKRQKTANIPRQKHTHTHVFFPDTGIYDMQKDIEKKENMTKPVIIQKNSATNFTKKVLSALCICSVLFTGAFMIADKKILSLFSTGTIHNFSRLFEKESDYEFSPDYSPIRARTLYTVEYKDESAQKIQNDFSQAETYPEQSDTSSDKTTKVITQQNENGVYSDGVKYFPITELDLSGDILNLSNETQLSPDTALLLKKKPDALKNIAIDRNPLVLIIHTHAGESYTQYDTMYPENEPTRNYDNNNVLEMGRQVKQTLSDFGINCIHSEKMHDKDSFINAYSNSAKTVKEYLEKYPSIRFVIDIHRDAIVKDNGESIKPTVTIASQKYAQLMFVVGTNQNGHTHPHWQENLCLALNVMQKANSFYPGLFRSINLRDVPFNQQLSTGYLLLEAGSSANLKEEAQLSCRAFAQSLASVIYES